ncbi:MAG: hypothetical protein PHY45_15635 [Rhodocyclaceae bacterium]|nr:hypothetical protein [Rhodocyclaceae bacterium]
MKRPRLHPLIALLCALCLLGAQQAANAHFIGHLGSAAEATAFHKGGTGGDAPALDGVCKTCAAFAALVAAPPAYTPPPAVARVPNTRLFVQAPVFTPAPPAPPYSSRAPPVVL